MRGTVAVGTLLALTLAPVTAGCACTQLAGAAGIDVSLPGSLQRETRRAEVEVCSEDGCQRSTVRVDDSGPRSFWVPLDERGLDSLRAPSRPRSGRSGQLKSSTDRSSAGSSSGPTVGAPV